MSDFFTPDELAELGFKRLGRDVLVSRRALILGAANISVGHYSRIDAFCVLSGGAGELKIGRNVHIGAHSTVMGEAAIVLEDFSGLSVRCSLFSSNEDYSGKSLTNPAVPRRFRGVTNGPVRVGAHAIIGAGAVVLPNVVIGAGSAVGALSLLRHSIPEFSIAVGNPAKVIGKRSREHVQLAETYLAEEL